MYWEIKNICKELGYHGWSFLVENYENHGRRMYLSKFDPEEENNNDEYRIYFFVTPKGVQIVRRFILVKSKYKKVLPKENRFYQEAEHILNTYHQKYLKVS